MKTSITGEVIESFLHCRRKAFFKFVGEAGLTHDFETLQDEITSIVRQKFIETVRSRIGEMCSELSIMRDGPEFV